MPIDAPVHTDEGNLSRVLGTGLPVMLVFWRRNCAPCDQLSPVLDQLARSYAGRALVVKVNADEEDNLMSRYNISRLPGIVFIKAGHALATASGAAGQHELATWLDYLIKGGARPAVPQGPSVAVHGAPAGNTAPPRQSPAGAPASGTERPAGDGQSGPVTLTDATFDTVIRSSKVPVLVDFWAVWCAPCRIVAPIVEQLAHEFAGRALTGKLNVDENPVIASRYGIMSIPTLLIFRDGQIVDRIVGAQPAPILRQKLAQQVR